MPYNNNDMHYMLSKNRGTSLKFPSLIVETFFLRKKSVLMSVFQNSHIARLVDHRVVFWDRDYSVVQ